MWAGLWSVVILLAVSRGASAAMHHLHIKDYPATTGCPSTNQQLTAWITERTLSGDPLLPRSTNYDDFVVEVKDALDQQMLPERAIDHLFSDNSPFHPTCSGQWLEFGVYRGDTLNIAAREKLRSCGTKCPPVFGFDTFTGLPEAWQRDSATSWGEHAFDQGGVMPQVLTNAELVAGLFSESLPKFLKEQARFAGANQTVSYLHIDCDLYGGSINALTILDADIRPGTVIVFDELVNYANFREHELKAFWEWLNTSGATVLAFGIKGPLPDRSHAVDLEISEGEHHMFHQSAAFVVAARPDHLYRQRRQHS